MSLRRFTKKIPDKKAIIEEEEDEDFKKPRASKGNTDKKTLPTKAKKKRGKKFLEDSESEEDVPKAKKPKPSASQSIAITKTPTPKNTTPSSITKKPVTTPTSKKGGTTPTSAGRSSKKSSMKPTVTLQDFFGDKPVKRVSRPKPPSPEERQRDIDTVPESPGDDMDTLFDKISKDVPVDYSTLKKEENTHEDEDFARTLQDIDTSSESSSQPSLKKMRLKVKKAESSLSTSSVSHISDSPPSPSPASGSKVAELASTDTPTKRTLRSSKGTPLKSQLATPRKAETPKKSATPKKARTPKKMATPKKIETSKEMSTPEKVDTSDRLPTSGKVESPLKGQQSTPTKTVQKSISSFVKQTTPLKDSSAKKVETSHEPMKSPTKKQSTQSTVSPKKQIVSKKPATSKKSLSSKKGSIAYIDSDSPEKPSSGPVGKTVTTQSAVEPPVQPDVSTEKEQNSKKLPTSKKLVPKKRAFAYIDEDDEVDGAAKPVDDRSVVRSKFFEKKPPASQVKKTSEPPEGEFSSPPPSKVPKQTGSVTPRREARSVTPKTSSKNVPKVTKSVSLPPVTPEQLKAQKTESYIKYLNRSGPRHPGSKEIPTGADNCLEGLAFVITGVLDSLEREEAADIIKKYGGRVTGNVSGKTNYLVMGEDAGESKKAKAEQHGTKIIDEDGLLDLIKTRPGPAGKRSLATKKSGSKKPAPPQLKSSASEFQQVKVPKKESVATLDSQSVPAADRPSSSGAGNVEGVALEHGGDEDVVKEKSVSRIGGDREAEHLLWVDKYKPTSTKQLIGQKGDLSNVAKLTKWIRNWTKNRSDSKSKDGGAKFKAVLLAGPPGVGKTTTAQLVCKEEGYTFVEMNASSCRNKSALQNEVACQLSSTAMSSFLARKEGVASGPKKRALIMDEVDGMDGNADRGGVSELIFLIKGSPIPIICICNDHQSNKMRSLINHCYLLTFTHPKVEQIRGAMMSVCFKEEIKISPQTLSEMIVASGLDVRQVLHNLSLWSATDDPDAGVKAGVAKGMMAQKLKYKSPFDVVKKVFEPFEGERELSLQEKSELFFTDYSMAALYVQENYPKARPKQPRNVVHQLRSMAMAADSLSLGDLVERQIRSDSRWELLPHQSYLSSVIPGEHCKGVLSGRPTFPRWLGMNSSTSANSRSLQDLQQRTHHMACCNKSELGSDYLPYLIPRLTTPLISKNGDGIPEVMELMEVYGLKKDDWDTLQKFSQFSNRPDRSSQIPSKVKAAFTRAWNKKEPSNKDKSKQ